jgi:anti-anti-sigma factor
MTTAITAPGNYTFDCGGAQIRAHCRQLATVVTVRGEVDAVNVDRAGEYIRRFILGTHPLVLDMSGVSHFGAAGISLLYLFDEACRSAGVEWILVGSPAVTGLLGDGCDNRAIFPIARSLHEALRDLADAIVTRRQTVLALIRQTA